MDVFKGSHPLSSAVSGEDDATAVGASELCKFSKHTNWSSPVSAPQKEPIRASSICREAH